MRYAFRSCRKNAGFSAAVVLIVSLAVGGSATVFSIFNAALLRPLPYRNSDRVVVAWEKRPKEGSRENGVTPADYLDWRARNHVFASLTAHDEGPVTLAGQGTPERLIAVSASTDMLATYGVQPIAGRGFTSSDERAGGRVVLLSYGFWQQHYGASRTAIGSTIQLDQRPYTVIGILPQDFRIYFGAKPDVFIPLVLSGARRVDRGSHDLLVIGRLRPGIGLPEAQADMAAISSRLEKDWPKANTGHETNLVPIDAQLRNAVGPTLLVLMLAVLFVLLIACANVANLTLARGFSRQRELAVREALGAGRMRLVRLLLAESLLLSGLGGVLGCGFAFGMLQVLKPLLPRIAGVAWIPGMDSLSIDRNVLLFIALVSALSGLLFGIVPAWRFSRSSLQRRIKDSGRLQGILIVTEAALSCILLTGATLLLTSFVRLSRVNPGFQAGQRISLEVTIPPELRETKLEDALYRRMIENTAALPAVRSTALTNYVPGFTTGWRWGLRTEAHPEVRSIQDSLKIWMRVVSPGFVSTMGIPIIAGRSLGVRDTERSEPVVLLSETAVRRYLSDGHAVGRRIAFGDQTTWRTVVGVVGSVKHLGLSREAEPEVYVPLSQSPMPFASIWLIAHFNGPTEPIGSIRHALASANPSLAIGRVQLIEEILAQSKAPERFNTVLIDSFAALSFILALAGIYSVLAFLVARQTREIGIRMALGAQRSEILGQFMRRVARLALLGICIGTVASLLTNGLIRSFLFGVSPFSPAAYATVSNGFLSRRHDRRGIAGMARCESGSGDCVARGIVVDGERNRIEGVSTMANEICPECGLEPKPGQPNCQTQRDELMARDFEQPALYWAFHRMAVDAYCLQHAPYVASAKSLAAHLCGLCIAFEHGRNAGQLRQLQQWLSTNPKIEKPELPAQRGEITIGQVYGISDPVQFGKAVEAWARSVWDAYRNLQPLARDWLSKAVAVRRS